VSRHRYKDILPYDEFRVQLNKGKSYINASTVTALLPGAPVYLAAQGPTPETVGHFWKMIMENKSVIIAMLTRCVESNKRKCEQYWPAAGASFFFDADDSGPAVCVVGNGEVQRELWTERRFTVVSDAGSTDVTQLHFTGWPDHGVPDEPTDAIKFIQEVMRVEKASTTSSGRRRAPIAVHCSAGVGRTGVFSVLHAIMTHLPAYSDSDAEPFDIINMVRHMRKSRRYMVQTIEQFRFCFDAAIKIVEQYIDAVRATGRLNPSSSSSSSSPPGGAPQPLLPAVLAKQLKESLRREFDANRARSELQKDLLEMTTGVRDSAVAADLREDVALARQRMMQMAQRQKEQDARSLAMQREMENKNVQIKQLATIVGQLEMDLADKEDEIAALRRKVESLEAGGGARGPPEAPDADYLAVGGVEDDDDDGGGGGEDERGYIVMDPGDGDAPSADDVDLDDDGGALGFNSGDSAPPKPVVVLGGAHHGSGDDMESDSEL
jgi:protein tyrosine phosphatase